MTAGSGLSVEEACARLRDVAQGASPWEWDGRFEAGLLAFDKSTEKDVLGVLDEVFDRIWSAKEMASAPREVQSLESQLGGLRSGQMLLTAGAGLGGPVLWCAWWPWGSGERISIRVGVLAPALDAAAAQASLRTALGV